MIRSFYFLLLMALAAGNAIASEEFEKPDYKEIKQAIEDSTSRFYYPKLMSRLNQFDTTLALQEYRHLYFGYIYQEVYDPYFRSPKEEGMAKYYRSKNVEKEDLGKMIKLCQELIDEFPFDLRALNFLAYVYQMKGNKEMAKKVSKRFNDTIDAIMSSGDGKSCKTGIHVISTNHEYTLLSLLNLKFKSQALTTDQCDYMAVEKNARNVEGLYFDVNKLFEHFMDHFKTK